MKGGLIMRRNSYRRPTETTPTPVKVFDKNTLYHMDIYNGYPRICIAVSEDSAMYVTVKKDVHGRMFLTEHKEESDGRFFDQWRSCDATIIGQNESTLTAIIGWFLAECSMTAFAEYSETINYDGADSEDPEPDNEFWAFIEAVNASVN